MNRHPVIETIRTEVGGTFRLWQQMCGGSVDIWRLEHDGWMRLCSRRSWDRARLFVANYHHQEVAA